MSRVLEGYTQGGKLPICVGDFKIYQKLIGLSKGVFRNSLDHQMPEMLFVNSCMSEVRSLVQIQI